MSISGLRGKEDNFTPSTVAFVNHTALLMERPPTHSHSVSINLRCVEKTDQTDTVATSQKYLIKRRSSLIRLSVSEDYSEEFFPPVNP